MPYVAMFNDGCLVLMIKEIEHGIDIIVRWDELDFNGNKIGQGASIVEYAPMEGREGDDNPYFSYDANTLIPLDQCIRLDTPWFK